jgi:hypothetical protein
MNTITRDNCIQKITSPKKCLDKKNKHAQPDDSKTTRSPLMSISRLTALRLTKLNSLLVKEQQSPVTFKMNIVEPLSEAQLNCLVQATPWNPTTIEAQIGPWNPELASFDATITLIEMPSKIPTQTHRKVLKWGHVKRKRGYLSHD